MRRSHIRLLSSILLLTLFTGVTLPYLPVPSRPAEAAGTPIDASASPWALAELELAQTYGLTYPGIMTQFTLDITREEFCVIVVKLHEKLTGKAVQAGPNPFGDTANPEVIKAFQLGIVNGTAPGSFSPAAKVTRQQMCAMIFRALTGAIAGLDTTVAGPFPFTDAPLIASYALAPMKFCYQHEIMKGVSATSINPLGNTTREQGIVLIKRTYEQFRSVAVVTPPEPEEPELPEPPKPPEDGGMAILLQPAAQESEIVKFVEQDFVNNLGRPGYQSKLTLYAASEAAKPASKPTADVSPVTALASGVTSSDAAPGPLDGTELAALPGPIIINPPILPIQWNLPRPAGSVYTKSSYGALVDRNGIKQRWFAFTLQTRAGTAANVVWQVSKSQFTGFVDGWRNPPGLVKSGQVAATAGEFMIDFGTFATAADTEIRTAAISPGILPRPGVDPILLSRAKEIVGRQRTYYVRAVPVDAQGNPIGDPGTGVAVLYGDPLVSSRDSTRSRLASFELWAPYRQGDPGGRGEFINSFDHSSLIRGFNPTFSDSYWFMWKGTDAATTSIVVQASLKPFDDKIGTWDKPGGLVYSRRYDTLPVVVNTSYPNSVPVPFAQFGIPVAQLIADQLVPYYVRVVALRPSNVTGAVDPYFSETIRVEYGIASMPKFYTPVDVLVKSYVPQVKILRYEPVQWQDKAWAEHYVVFRAPKWDEITCRYKSSDGTILYTYAYYNWQDPTITPARYEQEIIPKVLKVGTKVRIAPPQTDEDKSWWEELIDGIVGFFEDLWSITKQIVNLVSKAYADFKAGLINWVASQLPIPGLKLALEMLVNYGLACLGIPPTLPNFDQLADMSLDYLARVAITEAGVLPGDMTAEMLSDVTQAIGAEVIKAAAYGSPNPINAPFLKADPKYLYRPAYMDIELKNPYSDRETRAGTLNIDSEWEWRETGYTISHDTWAQLPVSQQYADALNYTMHFIYGLKRGHAGYPVYYLVYEPIRGYKIPTLKPGQTTTVRIYLTEYTNKPYPFALLGETVVWEDFANLYWGMVGPARFTVTAGPFDLPDPRQAALDQGYVEEPYKIYTYRYDYNAQGALITTVPKTAWSIAP